MEDNPYKSPASSNNVEPQWPYYALPTALVGVLVGCLLDFLFSHKGTAIRWLRTAVISFSGTVIIYGTVVALKWRLRE